ncbi:MAG TPA: Hsp20/alpha crystallin family protein [Streptosporangiaceae bacterium]|nr:Hsp20/alpha crystallin family protein [Streptosporangiaceae bacterium]
MSTLTRREYRGPLGEMVDWLEAPWAVLRPMTGHPMRVEEFVQDGSYVIRAELPGIDPEKDVTVTVANGILTIKAERHEEAIGKHHSEFRYGTFSRSVALPAGADEDHIDATCSHGVLEVTVKLAAKDTDAGARKIAVRQDQHIKPT